MKYSLKISLFLSLILSLTAPFEAAAGIEAYGTSDTALWASSTGSYGIFATSSAPSTSSFFGPVYYAGIYASGIDRGVWASGGNGVYAEATDSDGYGIVSFSPAYFGYPSSILGGQIFLGIVCTSPALFGPCISTSNVFRIDRAGTVYANGGYYGSGADVAEYIPVLKAPTLADVVEIDPDHEGFFRPAESPNSTMVAGVISSNPGLTMNAADPAGGRPDQGPKLALTGRVPVKVSAENGVIKPGDLLVSSSTAGHAMRAPSHPLAGTIIGKALGSLKQGTGTVEMLIMLR